ncbi:MAG TPA: peptide chain release factor N(5)-glutamine methyltransferase [Rubrivivax sp.]|nr:peptide chain release factor N(5)-glutamine methyltransferase [Rubrivivax sp.]
MKPPAGTVEAALAQARALGVARLDAQLLLAHLLQRPRAWLLAHDDAPLTPAQQHDFETQCRRRAGDEPLAYLLGQREFHGLMLDVSPAVLVPRPDTETLVDWGLELLQRLPVAAPQVADLGSGSGAIALALKHRHPAARVCAVERSAAALEAARANAARLALEIEWLAGDWWRPLAGRRLHLVLSNPPYIAAGDPHLPALRHEPAEALTAGDDGLAALRSIIAGAGAHLQGAGWLLLEHGHEQAEAVRGLLTGAGFDAVSTRTDLAGRPRCSGGLWHGGG